MHRKNNNFLNPKKRLKVMNHPISKGIGFGLTSGVITTIGLIIGLYESTHSKLAILSGIFVIAVGDALSDSLGMHVSEEASKRSNKDIWTSTITTFLAKFFIAVTFAVPVILLSLETSMYVSIIWAFLVVIGFNLYLGNLHGKRKFDIILEHLILTIIVIITTYFVGKLAAYLFS